MIIKSPFCEYKLCDECKIVECCVDKVCILHKSNSTFKYNKVLCSKECHVLAMEKETSYICLCTKKWIIWDLKDRGREKCIENSVCPHCSEQCSNCDGWDDVIESENEDGDVYYYCVNCR